MKKLFTIVISSLLLLSFAIVSCEKEDLGTATIYGVVTDKASGEPIQKAGVELSPSGLKTITGTDGRFEFTGLMAGNYFLSELDETDLAVFLGELTELKYEYSVFLEPENNTGLSIMLTYA